ncbi:MAG: alpha/beta hydrolase [Saprospiraceae bacterium]|nr:alpha/beta hydrolase [Saprospiraceae bacterium]
MNKFILFIQGGGEGGYEVDKELVASLQTALGSGYEINYPEIESDESAPDFGWCQQIGKYFSETKSAVILVGHSFGASMILKFLSENPVNKKIEGIFLVATPFWDGNEDWQSGLKLQENFADRLPVEVPVFFYHSADDEEIPFSHLIRYKEKLKGATFRILKEGGHQLNNDLTLVANDIKAL